MRRASRRAGEGIGFLFFMTMALASSLSFPLPLVWGFLGRWRISPRRGGVGRAWPLDRTAWCSSCRAAAGGRGTKMQTEKRNRRRRGGGGASTAGVPFWWQHPVDARTRRGVSGLSGGCLGACAKRPRHQDPSRGGGRTAQANPTRGVGV